MNPKEVFEANLSIIERVIERVCRVARLPAADAEDFASIARLHLIENDYDVIRRHDHSASLATYLTVVVQRLLINMRNHDLGRWRPSVAAQRMGSTAVLLERLLHRDRRPLAEIVPIVLASDGKLSASDVVSMAGRLPDRSRHPRTVEIDAIADDALPSVDDAAARVDEAERRRLVERTGAIIREALAALPVEDRMILKMRFVSSMQISDIARMLALPQRPLYRRIEALLARLRDALALAGIGASDAADLIGGGEISIDSAFGAETADARQSMEMKGPRRERSHDLP